MQPDWLDYALVGVVAGLFTFFDLDRTFYVPRNTQRKLQLFAWWWGFILFNAGLAIGVYCVPQLRRVLPDIPRVQAIVAGLAYLALARLKIATFGDHDKQDKPAGVELLYEAAKTAVFKRINRIAMDARYVEAEALAAQDNLLTLGHRAKARADMNSLLSIDERTRIKSWISEVLNDTHASDEYKKIVIANYILSGERS